MYISKKTLWILLIVFIIIMGLVVFNLVFGKKSIETDAPVKGYVAIVIDDLGGNGEGIDELLHLDIPITAAIMPFLEATKSEAEKCNEAGLEIILHIPMEPEHGSPNWLGPRPIIVDKTDDEIRNIVEDGLKEVKYAKGMNNHMGSKIMKDKRIMTEVLKIAKENNLFFLDSLTGDYTVANEISHELGVVYFSRDVFLDNSKNKNEIKKAMEKLAYIALKKGYSIGIGHVGGQGGKATIEVIEEMKEELKAKGIEFVYLSELKDVI